MCGLRGWCHMLFCTRPAYLSSYIISRRKQAAKRGKNLKLRKIIQLAKIGHKALPGKPIWELWSTGSALILRKFIEDKWVLVLGKKFKDFQLTLIIFQESNTSWSAHQNWGRIKRIQSHSSSTWKHRKVEVLCELCLFIRVLSRSLSLSLSFFFGFVVVVVVLVVEALQ